MIVSPLYHIFSHKTTEGGIGLGIEGLYKMTKMTHLHFGVNHEDFYCIARDRFSLELVIK